VLTVFCYGCNLGPTQTARSIKDLDRFKLAFVNQRHITEANLNEAIATVVNTYVQFPLQRLWGLGHSASADVYDHAVRINEMVDTLRELLGTALDANLSLISVSQNKDTKRLAAWAAIIAAPTAIAGIYGMNFQFMPELSWRYGYEAALGGMAMLCGGLWLGFKRSGWL
jgi:magnesium transporter